MGTITKVAWAADGLEARARPVPSPFPDSQRRALRRTADALLLPHPNLLLQVAAAGSVGVMLFGQLRLEDVECGRYTAVLVKPQQISLRDAATGKADDIICKHRVARIVYGYGYMARTPTRSTPTRCLLAPPPASRRR